MSAIDDYIASYPPPAQRALRKVRATIRKVLPKSEEAIKYGIPTFMVNGRNVVHFGAFTKHIGLYPAPRKHPDFKEDLAQYKGGKGTVQFPLDEEMPVALITRIVQHLASRAT